MDKSKLLISDYLDGELDGPGGELLAAALRNDPAHVEELAISSFVHFHLAEWMGQRRAFDAVLTGAVIPVSPLGSADHHVSLDANVARERAAADPPSPDGSMNLVHRRAARRRLLPLGLAAVLLIAASVSIVYLIASRPVIVAQLTQAEACQWDASQADLAVGALLQRGQTLRLLEGRALVTFVSGAQVVMEGPANLRLDAPKAAHLHGGRLTARVPSPALGFTITSPLAQFVDLGTEFTLALRKQDFELYVFEGLVEVLFTDRFGQAAGPLRIPESRAIHFDVDSGEVETLLCEESQRISL